MKKTLLALFLIPSIALCFPKYPDSQVTFPTYCKDTEKDFKEYRYDNIAVCNRNVTVETKQKIYDAYKIPAVERKEYTIDHLVPLFLGGSNQPTNLWPQHKSISTAKLEGATYNKLIKGEIDYWAALDTVMSQKTP